jgi:hypothetical protein
MKNLLTRPQLLQNVPTSQSNQYKRKHLDDMETDIKYVKGKKKGYQQSSTQYPTFKKY